MKKMNRREFLTLTGAAVVALSLAGCGGGSAAPAAPATPKDAKVLEAINLYRGKLSPLTLDSGLNKAAEEVAKIILSNKPLGESKDAFAEAHKAILGYKNAELYQPIGLSMNEVSEGTYKAAPRYVSIPTHGTRCPSPPTPAPATPPWSRCCTASPVRWTKSTATSWRASAGS